MTWITLRAFRRGLIVLRERRRVGSTFIAQFAACSAVELSTAGVVRHALPATAYGGVQDTTRHAIGPEIAISVWHCP